jgi:hypothetical protein
MHRHYTFCGLFPVMVWGLICLAGCSKTPKSYAPQIDADAAGKTALEQYDVNGDGKISGPELDRAASLKSNLEKIDTDNDKALTAEEIATRIRFWQSDKLYSSRAPIHLLVYHNRKPLAGAEVKLVPEKFLGDTMKIARGKTEFSGSAILRCAGDGPDDPPGVGPGFYRVEITKPGEPIPAKYNTETVLGIDTTADNPSLAKGIRFHLKY